MSITTTYGFKCYQCNQGEIKAIDYSNARMMIDSHDAINHNQPTAILVTNYHYDFEASEDVFKAAQGESNV